MLKTYTCPNQHSWEAMPSVEASGFDRSSICPLCQSTVDATPPPPSPSPPIVAQSAQTRPRTFGRYELIEELGRGGMGVVYKARDPLLDRFVALKLVLHGDYASDAASRRFRREAEAVAQLQHPNVVPVHDFGEEDGVPYYTMDYLTGGDLLACASFTSRKPAAAAALLAKIARGVHVAHERGIVHRDLKPANVLLTADGEPKVGDFGLAKRFDCDAADRDAVTQTASGTAIGTPAYMAPEQVCGRSDDLSPATDVFALGVILYEALTGRRPFAAVADLEGLRRAMADGPPDPSRSCPRLSRDLETICLKCLRYNPAERYASAGELADDLERFLKNEPVRARRINWAVRLAKWARRRPAKAIVAALAICLVVLLAYVAWYLDAYVIPRTECFAELTYRWGSPVGVGPSLRAEQVRRRMLSFEVHRRGRRGSASEVRAVNGFGQEPLETPFRTWFDGLFASQQVLSWSRNHFEYGEDGSLARETAYDPTGRLVYELQYSYPSALGGAQSRPKADIVRVRYFREMGLDLEHVAGPTTIELRRNAQGLDEEVLFFDGHGQPKPNAEGTFGYRIAYGPLGLASRIENLDALANSAPSQLGFVAAAIEHDALGHETRTAYQDANGNPTRSADGTAIVASDHDAFGNTIALRYLDEVARPTTNDTSGVAQIRFAFGDHGDLRSLSYSGVDGLPTGSVARMDMRHDQLGRVISMDSWNSSGALLGVADQLYDSKGRLVQRTVWADPQRRTPLGKELTKYVGDRVASEQVYSPDRLVQERRYEFDDRGSLWRVGITDGSGKPLRVADGYSGIERRFHDDDADENRTVSEIRWSGYAPTARFASKLAHYDRQGALVGIEFLDASGHPAPGPRGISRQVIERGPSGTITAVHFFDVSGAPVSPAVIVLQALPSTGLRNGDRLLRCGDHAVCSAAEFFQWAILEPPTGSTQHNLEILRKGQPLNLPLLRGYPQVTLEERLAD
jgi:hypothetical protein